MPKDAGAYDRYLKEHQETHLQELFEFLRIPTVSALSEHKQDIRRGAEWVAAQMKKVGLTRAEVIPTAGHPLVYGEWLERPGLPTVLVYGHYDVQPVDPLDLWDTPPFEPQVRDGQLYARGSSDDKGQVFMHLKALETLLAVDGTLPLNFKFLIEGEEEVGGEHLDSFIRENHELLQADALVISDTTMFDRGYPALCTGLRGLAVLEVRLEGPATDLHSGLFGGAVQNPIHALAELLAGLHRPDGSVAVEGFYDRVRPAAEAEKSSIAALPFSDEDFLKDVGAPALFGESGYTTLERLWTRPTLEVNGIGGGFQGEGTKTVIPARAFAKITCRLVPDQDPDTINDLIEAHLKKHCPTGVRLQVQRLQGGKPTLVSPDHPAVTAAAEALNEAFGVRPAFIRMGGSIPVVQTFQEELKVPVVLLGFSLPDEKFHAPNEHFDLGNYRDGLKTLCRYWPKLASWRPQA